MNLDPLLYASIADVVLGGVGVGLIGFKIVQNFTSGCAKCGHARHNGKCEHIDAHGITEHIICSCDAITGPVCTACEAGDHERSYITEGLMRCDCACHCGRGK